MNIKRGRPRQYNPDQALDRAMRLFWSKGYTATSLDDLSAATNMNRPSLYNAFGNKEQIYRQAFARFITSMRDDVETNLFSEPDLKLALMEFYHQALNIYFGRDVPLGCFITSTAPAESITHPDIRRDLNRIIREVDLALERRLEIAQESGQWPQDKNAKMVAKLLHATLQSIALRARGGESRRSLKAIYTLAVDTFC